ncbi:MAG: hypothetical protein ACLP8S_17200 [Solirubrobacteraceae bacterium]
MSVKPIERAGRRLARSLSIAALALAAAGGGLATLPSAATAGTYSVYMCENGYGTAAFQNGWSSDAGKSLDASANCTQPGNSIGKGDGLQVWSGGSAVGSEAGAYWLRAPAGTSITGLTYAGLFNSYGGWVAHWATSESGGGDPVDDCDTTQSCTGGALSDESRSVANASLIGFGLWCAASSCEQNSSESAFGPAGSANVFNATVTITEPSPPSLNITGFPTGWISNENAPSGGWTVSASASDPAGVCDLSLSVAGLSQIADVTPNYGSAIPCHTGTPQTAVNLNPCESGGLGAGSYTPTAAADNPAGMRSSATSSQFNVECSGPQLSVSSTENLGVWYAAPQTVDVDASDPSGLYGDVDCSVGQQTVAIAPSQLPYSLVVSQNGANSVSCTAANNVNYSTSTSLDGQVRIDDQVPSVAFSGATPAPAWVSGPQTIRVTGSEATQLSGIASVLCEVDGGGWTTTDGSVASITISTDGVHTISCYGTTGAGVKSPTETYAVQIDSVPPTISFSNGPSQSTWATTAQSIDVTASKAQGSSGVAEISCTLNQQTSVYTNSGDPDSQTVKITVQPPGGDLSCKAQDNAGNWSAAQAWNFLIDNTVPTGEFLPPDPTNPTQVAVQLADTASGVAGAQIEIQTAGGWRQLATNYDASTGIATATIPDDGSLTDGTYNLQALVWSVAGNEATITQGAAGTPAAVTLPLRIVTQLLVGQAKASVDDCSMRRAVLHGVDRYHQTLVTKLVKRCDVIEVPHARMTRLRYGQRASVQGLLETVDGTPIPDQKITIAQQATGWRKQAVGSLLINSHGRFTYTLRAGASRTVTFSYPGTDILRSTSATTGVRVVGKGTINVGEQAVAGRTLRISGRLDGGYIPFDGVLVQLWYRVKGIPASFGPFDNAIHTNRAGAWTVTFPVSTGARGYTYLFKAVIAQQTDWPFLTTSTNVVERYVS